MGVFLCNTNSKSDSSEFWPPLAVTVGGMRGGIYQEMGSIGNFLHSFKIDLLEASPSNQLPLLHNIAQMILLKAE